jgi:hypothetical protein
VRKTFSYGEPGIGGAGMKDIQLQIEELDKKIAAQFEAIEARLKENTEFVRAFFKEHPEEMAAFRRTVKRMTV